MKIIVAKLYSEPAVFVGVGTGMTALAAGMFDQAWLAFCAGAFAVLGSVFVRQNVSPVER